MTVLRKQYIRLDIKSVRALQHVINLTLDTTKNRNIISRDDMLRLMVIRAELEDMGSKDNQCQH